VRGTTAGLPDGLTLSNETVTWQQTVPSWEKFTIVGPGAINGHVGWVPRARKRATTPASRRTTAYTVTYAPYGR
jgi:hypothetical protein